MNKNNNEIVGNQILIRSGLKDIKEYEGHGVDRNDLNTIHLMCVFRDLIKVDPMFALEFIDLVNSMEVLSATNFINIFKAFVNNGFSTEGLIEKKDNDKLLTMFDLSGYSNVNDIIESATIKSEFINNTLDIAKKMQREYAPMFMEHTNKKIK